MTTELPREPRASEVTISWQRLNGLLEHAAETTSADPGDVMAAAENAGLLAIYMD